VAALEGEDILRLCHLDRWDRVASVETSAEAAALAAVSEDAIVVSEAAAAAASAEVETGASVVDLIAVEVSEVVAETVVVIAPATAALVVAPTVSPLPPMRQTAPAVASAAAIATAPGTAAPEVVGMVVVMAVVAHMMTDQAAAEATVIATPDKPAATWSPFDPESPGIGMAVAVAVGIRAAAAEITTGRPVSTTTPESVVTTAATRTPESCGATNKTPPRSPKSVGMSCGGYQTVFPSPFSLLSHALSLPTMRVSSTCLSTSMSTIVKKAYDICLQG